MKRILDVNIHECFMIQYFETIAIKSLTEPWKQNFSLALSWWKQLHKPFKFFHVYLSSFLLKDWEGIPASVSHINILITKNSLFQQLVTPWLLSIYSFLF